MLQATLTRLLFPSTAFTYNYSYFILLLRSRARLAHDSYWLLIILVLILHIACVFPDGNSSSSHPR